MAELVRHAIDRVYRTGRKVEEFERALDQTFGMLRKRRDIRSGVQFHDKVRRLWDRRLSFS